MSEKIDLVLAWGFGGYFLIFGIINLFLPSHDFVLAIGTILISFFILPPVRDFFYLQTDMKLSVGTRATYVVLLLIISTSFCKNEYEIVKNKEAVTVKEETIFYENKNKDDYDMHLTESSEKSKIIENETEILNKIVNKYNMKLEVEGSGSNEYSFDYSCKNISRELSISNLRFTTYYNKPFQLRGNLIPDSVGDIDYIATGKPLDIEKALALTCKDLEKTIPMQIQALQNR